MAQKKYSDQVNGVIEYQKKEKKGIPISENLIMKLRKIGKKWNIDIFNRV